MFLPVLADLVPLHAGNLDGRGENRPFSKGALCKQQLCSLLVFLIPVVVQQEQHHNNSNLESQQGCCSHSKITLEMLSAHAAAQPAMKCLTLPSGKPLLPDLACAQKKHSHMERELLQRQVIKEQYRNRARK